MSPSGESPPAEEYGKLEHANKAKTPLASPPRLRTPVIKPSRPGYEDIDLDFPAGEGYGKLERREGGSPPWQPPRESHVEAAPPLPPLPREGRETSKSPMQDRRTSPKKPLPYHGKTRLSASPPGGEDHALDVRTHPNHTHHMEDQYETLDDAAHMQVVHPEQYGKPSHTQFTSPTEESYGKLDSKTTSGFKKLSVPSPTVDPAGMEALAQSRIRHTHHSLSQISSENYGKLDRGTNKLLADGCLKSKREQEPPNSSQQENYGKLDHGSSRLPADGCSRLKHEQAKPKPAPRQSSSQSPGEEYGRLERNIPASSHFSFDPYGSLPKDLRDPDRISITSNTSQDSLTRSGPGYIIEEESSTPLYNSINKKGESTSSAKMPVYSSLKKPDPKKKLELTPTNSISGVPPPGYENSKPLGNTAAAQAALQTANGIPPVVPPRAAERSKLHYQNIGADGKVLLHRQPLSDEGMVDNKMYSLTSVARDNDYIEGDGVEVWTSPATGVTCSTKPLPAPKPKIKPKPRRS